MVSGDSIAAGSAEGAGKRREGRLSLWFASDARPTVDAVAACSVASGQTVGFAISHRPAADADWLELLALGLTYDLRGLQPGIPADVDARRHVYGLRMEDLGGLEPVVLAPGPHLASGGTLLPVIRAMLALGCELCALPGLVAVGWDPAGTAMAPDYFRRTVSAWLDGGVFPGLGLTALLRNPDGALETEGLALFIGHEIALASLPGEPPAEATRYSLRLIHHLVENGPYSAGPAEGPAGESLECEFVENRTVLRVTRTGALG